MLKSLDIYNFVIIDAIHIDFHPHLNILTGETGAGKSIILGALQLITGERADISLLLNKNEKCTIEGVFKISSTALKDFFLAHELEFDEETIIRREIQPSGKSRAFINDSPVTLQILKELSEYLVDIHSQNESLALKSNAFQLSIVDAFADHDMVLQEYTSLFTERKKKQKLLDLLIEDTQKSNIELDFLQFQFKELSEANLEDIHVSKDEADLKSLEHAEEIKSVLFQILHQWQESENNVHDVLMQNAQSLHKLSKYHSEIEILASRFDGLRNDLKDLFKEISLLESNSEFNPEKIIEIQERLNLVYKLNKKHQTNDMAALIAIRDEAEVRLNNIQFSNEKIDPLKKEISEINSQLLTLAKNISKNRNSIINGFEQKIKTLLSSLGMPNANFVIQCESNADKLTATGIDDIKFLFSANKGSMLQEIKKAISGGEMSRFMLCLKTMMAEKMQLPTLIFDEIDTGVSGDIAHKVGMLLQELSSKHQLVAITHLPQLASKGNHHLYVYKVTDDKKTITNIKLLSESERKNEIAKMLSGEKITETAIANAAELLGI